MFWDVGRRHKHFKRRIHPLAKWAVAAETDASQAFHDLANPAVHTDVEALTARIVVLAQISSIQAATAAHNHTTKIYHTVRHGPAQPTGRVDG